MITWDHQSEDFLEQLDDLDLAEPVLNSPFLLKDVVDVILCKDPFANTLELHPDQLRPVLFFAFRGDRQVIPQRIKRTFKRLNIKVNGVILQKIIQELVDAGLQPETVDRGRTLTDNLRHSGA
ncbi:MAG: hypothetical protein ACFE9L_05410 [Candidatus Hodarchaeota archaeon]